MTELVTHLKTWAAANQAIVALTGVCLIIVVPFIGFIVRLIFSRPSIRLAVIEGPSFICTHPTYLTAAAVYLRIINRGGSPTDIIGAKLAFHGYTPQSTFFWQWTRATVCLEDFQVAIGDHIKVYPFMLQVNAMIPDHASPATFLDRGQAISGVVYFEYPEAWGGLVPRVKRGNVRLKISIEDSRRRTSSRIIHLKKVKLDEARRFNPSFGMTGESLRQVRPDQY